MQAFARKLQKQGGEVKMKNTTLSAAENIAVRIAKQRAAQNKNRQRDIIGLYTQKAPRPQQTKKQHVSEIIAAYTQEGKEL